jgi:hypothetical protein
MHDMSRSRRRVLLASTTLAVCIGACKDGGTTLIDRGSCDVLIECAAAIAPEARDEYESVWGQNGTCWQNANPMAWAACRDACKQTLDTINLAGMITGQTCGTCSSDADCSQFGNGAFCDAGLCSGGDGVSDEGETGDGGDGDGDGDGGDGDGEVPPPEAVSILLVVDNSGSMGKHQENVIARIDNLVAPIESAGIPWRLGVTTTDNGNPWCPAGQTTPEGGKLVFTPCTTRLGDFLFGADVDVQSVCTNYCKTNSVTTVPTTTLSDANAKPRPWIESANGQTNLANGVDTLTALRCIVPQGVNGCGFESQLDSAALTVARSASNQESEYGFVEPGRLLVIVFISDEADCSDNPTWADIFNAGGSKTFWSDPSALYPTSAVCWNAGVQCIGNPSGYASCDPVDKAIDGSITTDPDAAVLYPVKRFVDAYRKSGPVLTFGILGVKNAGEAFYADVTNTDPAFQESFGIGPGCTASGGVSAVPPVRMRSVLEQLGPENGQAAFSICNSDFGPALTAIGTAIAAEF